MVAYTLERTGIHPQQQLEWFNGTLQVDAYGGYQTIYDIGGRHEGGLLGERPITAL
jgi:hypothetical protein